MIKDFEKTTTMTARSAIGDEVAVSMRATLNEDGTWNVSKHIRNTELYLANQEQCEADYVEFEAEVLRMTRV